MATSHLLPMVIEALLISSLLLSTMFAHCYATRRNMERFTSAATRPSSHGSFHTTIQQQMPSRAPHMSFRESIFGSKLNDPKGVRDPHRARPCEGALGQSTDELKTMRDLHRVQGTEGAMRESRDTESDRTEEARASAQGSSLEVRIPSSKGSCRVDCRTTKAFHPNLEKSSTTRTKLPSQVVHSEACTSLRINSGDILHSRHDSIRPKEPSSCIGTGSDCQVTATMATSQEISHYLFSTPNIDFLRRSRCSTDNRVKATPHDPAAKETTTSFTDTESRKMTNFASSGLTNTRMNPTAIHMTSKLARYNSNSPGSMHMTSKATVVEITSPSRVQFTSRSIMDKRHLQATSTASTDDALLEILSSSRMRRNLERVSTLRESKSTRPTMNSMMNTGSEEKLKEITLCSGTSSCHHEMISTSTQESGAARSGMMTNATSTGAPKEFCVYTIVTETGKQAGAGTNSKISLRLSNKDDEGVYFTGLANGHRAFEKGHKDTFVLEDICVVNICKMVLYTDDTGLFSEWFVGSLSFFVRGGDNSGFDPLQERRWEINKWLPKDDDARELHLTLSNCP